MILVISLGMPRATICASQVAQRVSLPNFTHMTELSDIAYTQRLLDTQFDLLLQQTDLHHAVNQLPLENFIQIAHVALQKKDRTVIDACAQRLAANMDIIQKNTYRIPSEMYPYIALYLDMSTVDRLLNTKLSTRALSSLTIAEDKVILSAAYTEDGATLIVHYNNHIELYDMSQDRSHTIFMSDTPIHSVQFTHNQQELLICLDRCIVIYNFADTSSRIIYKIDEPDCIVTINYTKELHKLFIKTNKQIIVVDLYSGNHHVVSIPDNPAVVELAGYNKEGTKLLLAVNGYKCVIYHLSLDTFISFPTNNHTIIKSMIFPKNEQALLIWSPDNIVIYDMNTGRFKVPLVTTSRDVIESVSYVDDDRHLLIQTKRYVFLHNVMTDRRMLLASTTLDRPFRSAIYYENKGQVVIRTDRSVFVYDMQSHQQKVPYVASEGDYIWSVNYTDYKDEMYEDELLVKTHKSLVICNKNGTAETTIFNKKDCEPMFSALYDAKNDVVIIWTTQELYCYYLQTERMEPIFIAEPNDTLLSVKLSKDGQQLFIMTAHKHFSVHRINMLSILNDLNFTQKQFLCKAACAWKEHKSYFLTYDECALYNSLPTEFHSPELFMLGYDDGNNTINDNKDSSEKKELPKGYISSLTAPISMLLSWLYRS